MSASEKMKDLHPLLCGPPAQKMRDDAWDALIAVVEAGEKVASLQPEALEIIRREGFVFENIGKEPGNWQHLAFTLYTMLCEAEAHASPALTALDVALGEKIE